jgi:hypothetical protein
MLFGGVLTFGVAGRGAIRELVLVARRAGSDTARAFRRPGG